MVDSPISRQLAPRKQLSECGLKSQKKSRQKNMCAWIAINNAPSYAESASY
jgi:hypothetical protein